MSEVKVNKITPTTNCGTVTLGDSGDTIAIPAGVNLTSGGALTNSGTITNTGSITGVAITGTIDNQVNWQTDSIKTTGFTAVAGEGYFCNTTSAAFTVTLPASPSAGDLVGIKDYANTADTNNITIGRNGSNIEGIANDFIINIEGGSITLIYVDATQGWLSTAASKASDISSPQFVTATGGTITTCGDYKIHTFTGPGTFCVSCAGNPTGNDQLEYLVVAGGGSGARGDGTHGGGGGGAGGFRFASPSLAPLCYPAKPLAGSTITASASAIPITVGAGGAGVDDPAYSNSGSNSIFSTITSAGGGGAGAYSNLIALAGGSGGGAGTCYPTGNGAGNTPPVSPSQGNDGGVSVGAGYASGGGGGGATAVGANGVTGPGNSRGGPGGAGAGVPNAFGTSGQNCGSNYYFSGGGGAGPRTCSTTPAPTGGLGGGGPGAMPGGTAGTTNTGGGGGSASGDGAGSNGGSGIVIIRYKFQ